MSFLDNFNKAFAYAVEKHSKQLRKGTKVPYIVHIYEVAQYLKEENAEEDAIIAGILHDVVEDTNTSIDEIKEIFGENIANLVECETEDKSLPYLVRKSLHMKHLSSCDEKTKLINCADKLSNLRSIYLDLKYYKDDVWKKFNGTPEEIKQYYQMALDALKTLKNREIYKKLQNYYDLIFVKKDF